jgi:hypothetical protein
MKYVEAKGLKYSWPCPVILASNVFPKAFSTLEVSTSQLAAIASKETCFMRAHESSSYT